MNSIIAISADELDLAARTVDGEAGSEPLLGKQAVVFVMRNRHGFQHPWWGWSIGQICSKPEQFSCWNGGPDTERIKALDPDSVEYQTARDVVVAVMGGTVADPTGGATTYKVRGTPAEWDAAVAAMPPRSIGKHDFWRLSPDGHCLPFLDEQDEAA